MNRFLSTFLAIVIVISIGFFAYPKTQTEVFPEFSDISPTNSVDDLLGVIQQIDAARQTVTMRMPDGGLEEIILFSEFFPAQDQLGLLALVSGDREPATRQIEARTFAVLDAPDLFITSPLSGATVTSPLVVFGFSRIGESALAFRILDNQGKDVQSGYAKVSTGQSPNFSPFRLEIFLPALAERDLTLELFEPLSGGRENSLVSLPLKLLTIDTVAFQVYFRLSGQGLANDCSLVFPVSRTLAQTSALGKAALLELLSGPTKEEQKAGYYSQLPASTVLNSLVLGNNQAVVNLSSVSQTPSVSCQAPAAREQIYQTLIQFPNINFVEIIDSGQ